MLNVKDSNEGKSVVFKVDKVMRQNEHGAENNSVVDVIWRYQKSHLFIVYHRINYMSFQHLTSIMSRFKLFRTRRLQGACQQCWFYIGACKI